MSLISSFTYFGKFLSKISLLVHCWPTPAVVMCISSWPNQNSRSWGSNSSCRPAIFATTLSASAVLSVSKQVAISPLTGDVERCGGVVGGCSASGSASGGGSGTTGAASWGSMLSSSPDPTLLPLSALTSQMSFCKRAALFCFRACLRRAASSVRRSRPAGSASRRLPAAGEGGGGTGTGRGSEGPGLSRPERETGKFAQ